MPGHIARFSAADITAGDKVHRVFDGAHHTGQVQAVGTVSGGKTSIVYACETCPTGPWHELRVLPGDGVTAERTPVHQS